MNRPRTGGDNMAASRMLKMSSGVTPMNFFEAIISGFSNYVNFSTRAARSEYWYWMLFIVLVGIAALFISTMLPPGALRDANPLVATWLLVVLLPTLAISVRRLHDIDKTGWWYFIVLIPTIGYFVLIYWACLEGTPGPNRFSKVVSAIDRGDAKHHMTIWQAMRGFDGRISRRYFWLAGLVWMIAFMVICLALLHWLSGGHWLDEKYDLTSEGVKVTSVAMLIPYVIGLYPFLALSIKRLHDLNRSGWWCLPAIASESIALLAPLLGLVGPPDSPNPLGHVLFWSSSAVGLLYIIVLGFIRGTTGPNGYGLTRSRDPRLRSSHHHPDKTAGSPTRPRNRFQERPFNIDGIACRLRPRARPLVNCPPKRGSTPRPFVGCRHSDPGWAA